MKPGTRIGPYEVTAPLGAGGMGEVYRATDTKLQREVAIKVLPDEVAQDPDRLARFEREARVLASLNHPHIASIYGLEDTGGVPCLVLELVEGSTLAETLAAEALPPERTLEIARQIASALAAAHEKRIIHRDLKPANVKLTPDGAVKVLDFGLAKALADEPPQGTTDPARSPTVTMSATRAGVILGTAAYMSPEQAQGKPVDERTDAWAFGCVLYEMLSGRQAFAGETAADCIAAILGREPDWSVLPTTTPRAVRRLLRACLARNPQKRLGSLRDVRVALDQLRRDADGETGVAAPDGPGAAVAGRLRWLLGGLALGGLAMGLAGWLFRPLPEAPPLPVRRYRMEAPGVSTDWVERPQISPDGRRVVYIAHDLLWVCDLDGLEPRWLDGTEMATAPFWSPDGASLGFGRDGQVWRIDLDGGPPRMLCDLPDAPRIYDGDWNDQGTIAFAARRSPIYEVPEQGGEPRVRVELDAESEVDFHSVRFLPDGETLLVQPHLREKGFGIQSDALIAVRPDGTRKVVLSDQTWSAILHGEFVSGHILYERRRGQKGVWAVPFSPATLEATGEPFPVALGARQVSASADGTLIYLPDEPYDLVQPALVDRSGTVIKRFGKPQPMLPMFALSPEGNKAVLTIGEAEMGRGDLWLWDLERDATSRLTSDAGIESMPNWSPDGSRIAYTRGVRVDQLELAIVEVENPSRKQSLGPGFRPIFSADGRWLVFGGFAGPNTPEIFYRELGDDGAPRTIPTSERSAHNGRISPDGRFIAYTAGTDGPEVFVCRFPDGTALQRVSTEGGRGPVWNSKGDELFYQQGDSVMAVAVAEGGTALHLGPPRELFTRPSISVGVPDGWNSAYWFSNLEVTRDGERFLMLLPEEQEETEKEKGHDEIVVLQNWLAASGK